VVSSTKNARMETSQHGQIVPKEHSKGGFVSCTYLEGFEGDRMTLMLEEKTRTVYKFEGVCARTGVN